MRTEEGFSIVGVLVMLACTLAAISILSKSRVDLQKSSKSLEIHTSYEVFVTNFTQFIQKSIETNAAQICNGDTTGLANLSFNQKPVAFKNDLIGPATAEMMEIQNRCRNPVFSGTSKIYFCLQFDKNPDFSGDDFTGAENNFAEIAVRPVDKWQQPVSCEAYRDATNGEYGLQIYYRFFWITKGMPEKINQKYGYYYGIKD